MWFRILALVLYEGSLVFWHYIHHYKTETPRQHIFSRNMERLSLAAVGTAAGYQLLTLVFHSFGDVLPGWTHTAIEIATAVVFMLQLFAFTKWEKLSHYYAAVEHAYNRQMTSGQTSIIEATSAATGIVDAPANRPAIDQPSDQNLALPGAAPEEEAEATADTDLAAPNVV